MYDLSKDAVKVHINSSSFYSCILDFILFLCYNYDINIYKGSDYLKHILAFGDSNTYGLVPGETSERFDYETRWTGLLDKAMRHIGYRVIDEGLCGRTTMFDDPDRDYRNGAKLLPYLLESHFPIDYVIIMLGTNDCKSCFDKSPEQIGIGMGKLISLVKAIDNTTKIILVSPIHLGERIFESDFDKDFNQKSLEVSKSLKQVYKNIAEKEKCLFLSASDIAKPSPMDMEHLDPNGHKALFKSLYDIILKQTKNAVHSA